MDVDEQIRENLGRVRQAAHRYARGNLRYDDAYADGLIGLWKAAKDFDETRGVPFGAYAWRRITGEILDGHKRFTHGRSQHVTMVSLDGLALFLADEHDGFDEWWSTVTVNTYLEGESPRNRQVIWAYLNRATFAEIGAEHGFSESRGNQIFRRWLKQINPAVPREALGHNKRKKAA